MERSMALEDSRLAGLGFAFQPVSLSAAHQGRRRPADPPRQPPAAAAAAAGTPTASSRQPPRVAFNLKERRPGAAYGSPQHQDQQADAQPQQDAHPALPGAAGLAALKLASLRRRAAAQAAAPPLPAPPPSIQQQAAALEAPAAQAQDECALLQGMEQLLAGCGAGALADAQPWALPPQHALPGKPVPADGAAPADWQLGDAPAGEPEQLIAACRPACMASSDSDAAAAPATAPANGPPPQQAAPGSPADALSDLVPQSLEEALGLLGLLAPRQQGEEAPAPAGAGTPQWLRLRAVQVVLAAKQQAAAATELLPLLRRLRQVRMHLAFHKANTPQARAHSPRRTISEAPPAAPWLSGRSSAVSSKHRSSRAGSPTPQRPKVALPTAEASELQVQLLGSLQHKLLLKLAVAVLRQAVSAARLRRRLLEHVAAHAAADLSRGALLGWHAAAIPSQQQEADAAALARQLAARRQRAQLAAWRQWAAQHAWRERQVARGQLALRHRLLSSAVQHWRCYCQQRLVERLQGALAARWAAAWSRRRVFAAWCLAARRSAALKAALLTGRTQQQQAPPTPMEALAATAAAFQPVKAFVAEAMQQLQRLQQGLRHWGPAEGSADVAAEEVQQPQEPLLLGSVASLLAALPLPQSPELPQLDSTAAALQQGAAPVAAVAAAGAAQPVLSSPACAAAEVAECSLPAPAPAPDPGSPSPAYNPASYASPSRHRRQERRQGGAAAAAPPPEAVGADLLDCQGRVEHLRLELEGLEQAPQRCLFDLVQEMHTLQQQCAQLEEAAAAAEQAARQRRHACTAAAAAKASAAEAMQAAVQAHSGAAAECSQQERQLQQRQRECQEAAAGAAAAQAAVHACSEQLAVANTGVQRWRATVEGAAKELAACHRTQQAPVMVRLKEARQRLEQHQQEAAAAQRQLPQLQSAAKQAGQRAAEAQQLVQAAEQRFVAAAEQQARLQRQLDAAIGQHEAAAVAAVAAQQEACAAEQQQRLLASQQQAAVGRLRQAAQQVAHKQQAAVLLQQEVQHLQALHHDAVAASLAAGHQNQRRSKLKRRLHAVQQGEAADALPSPSAVQQRRPPPERAAAAVPSVGALLDAAAPAAAAAAPAAAAASVEAGAAAALVVHTTPEAPWASWSCSTSELSSPRSEASPPAAPLTVDEAAARFYTHCLMRHALRTLRQEAASTRAAMQAAAERWHRAQLAAVLQAWCRHAAEAAAWLHAAGLALRLRSLLRQWRAAVAKRQWQRQAEAVADAFCRRRLLVVGVEAWRQGVRQERWRDSVHEAVVRMRLRNMLRAWRGWARQRRIKAARQRAALAVYQRRLLGAALRQWRWVQRSKALLRRVFGTAVELWQDEVGVRLHQRNFELVSACWGAWQLFVLQAQAARREAMLWHAAVAFRERQLLAAGLRAFQQEVAAAAEQRRRAQLQARLFAGWRRLAATSARHWRYEAARQVRRDQLLRTALAAWREAAEDTAGTLASFWARWQVQAVQSRALLAWRQVAAAQRSARELQGMADVHCTRQLKAAGLAAFAGATAAARTARECSASPPFDAHAGPRTQQRAQQHVQQQQRQQQQRLPAPPSAPQAQQAQPRGFTTRTTIIISQPASQCPAQLAVAASASSCAGASGSTTNWRAAAAYWQERHARLAQQPPLAQQQAVAVHPPAGVGPHTATTLSELRMRWAQENRHQQ